MKVSVQLVFDTEVEDEGFSEQVDYVLAAMDNLEAEWMDAAGIDDLAAIFSSISIDGEDIT